MAVPMISTGFGDLVDRRITKIFYDEYDQLPDVVPILFGMDNSSDQYETVSAVGALQDFSQFTGQVEYQDQNQGYDVTATHIEFASGIQIERALYDDDRHGIWESRPVDLAQPKACGPHLRQCLLSGHVLLPQLRERGLGVG